MFIHAAKFPADACNSSSSSSENPDICAGTGETSTVEARYSLSSSVGGLPARDLVMTGSAATCQSSPNDGPPGKSTSESLRVNTTLPSRLRLSSTIRGSRKFSGMSNAITYWYRRLDSMRSNSNRMGISFWWRVKSVGSIQSLTRFGPRPIFWSTPRACRRVDLPDPFLPMIRADPIPRRSRLKFSRQR